MHSIRMHRRMPVHTHGGAPRACSSSALAAVRHSTTLGRRQWNRHGANMAMSSSPQQDVNTLYRDKETHDQLSDTVASSVSELVDTDRTGELLIWIWGSIFGKKDKGAGDLVRPGSSTVATETVILGGGCFWCLDAVFRGMHGILTVECGYAGGGTPQPTYQQVVEGSTGHAEVVRLTFDPQRVSYSQILDVFLAAHEADTAGVQGVDIGSQYRSIILCESGQQQEAAHQALDQLRQAGKMALTEVVIMPQAAQQAAAQGLTGQVPAAEQQSSQPVFWVAEEIHQDFFGTFPGNGYCRTNVVPKLRKVKELYPELFKASP